MSLIKRAKQFAHKHHGAIDQRRKYTNDPYIVHPAAVAAIVRSVDHTPEMVAAAWLHDVVEDTPVELGEIAQRFGAEVAVLVEMLTDVSRPEDGNRAARKAIDRAHTALASPEAQTIKLADLIDNTASIVMNDPEFAKVYMAEKRLLLPALRSGDQFLLARATTLVDAYFGGGEK